jgi:hypothetical protein
MAFGAPQNPTNLKAAITYSSIAAAPDTFFLTPGSDTVAGGAGDTAVYSSPGDLNAGDAIDGGGGINVLYLDGTGTFDLSAPATLKNITRVLATGTASTVILRPGTSIDVQLNSSSAVGLNDSIIGADNADDISGSGNDTVTVGGTNETISNVGVAIITAATEGAQISASTLEVGGGGTVVLNANITAGVVKLDAATNLTVNENSGFVTVLGSPGADAITLDNPNTFQTALITFNSNNGADVLTKTPGAPVNGTLRGTAVNLNGNTFDGFNFAPSGTLADAIDITDFLYSSSETAQYASGVLVRFQQYFDPNTWRAGRRRLRAFLRRRARHRRDLRSASFHADHRCRHDHGDRNQPDYCAQRHAVAGGRNQRRCEPFEPVQHNREHAAACRSGHVRPVAARIADRAVGDQRGHDRLGDRRQ